MRDKVSLKWACILITLIKNIKYILGLALSILLLACSPSEQQKTWQLGQNVSQQAHISKSIRYILTTPTNAPVELWQLGRSAQGKFAWRFPNNIATGYTLTDLATPQSYAVMANGPYIIVWSTRTGKSLAFWKLPFNIREIKTSQTNQLSLIRTEYGEVKMINLRTGQIDFSIPTAKTDPATHISLAENSHYFAVGTQSGRVHLWNMKSKTLLHTLKLGKKVSFLKFSSHGNKILTSTYTGLSQIWYTRSGKLISTLKANGDLYKIRQVPAPVTAARFSTTDRLLATGSPGGIVRVWTVKSGYIHRHWQIPSPSFWARKHPTVLDLAFTSKAKSIITVTSENKAALWRLN
ncbi:hypothetical protein AVI51_08495 [Piscirickettsia salmonis]|uniref:Uncharacterized protein n=1 Tax=Piscirickettsia salmonis TaxID=1238 RepID=A0A9Q5YKZ6_PISSA|nr:WD domain, G-beta repeat family protein [Piscirickettsia salmonis]RNC79170.1 hypothetical protein DA717_00545 [Piscirickettsiaceae bacterium NZ-RLO2]ALA23895.1 WD domain, G-beta repeat family protein [Piscirickettsia salmonis]APS44311.1 hypothetical protein AVI48_08030 [Piscirickettsia salmonis]APS47672.1 hypothetical protein AVI49_08640 [Piscirickettsia salmonis]APS50896.1 hypothetical protein AVI50_08590 [Piscirickettsia salmonis]